MYTFDEKRVWSYAWDVMDDLSSVPQEYIIDYLLERLQRGQIYTWIDTVLLAINPKGENIFTEDIYDLSQVDKYRNVHIASCRKIQPHIFTVAIRAYYRLIQDLGKLSQVIVLNGETGTGKTFNAWKALEFLVAITVGNASPNIQKVDTSCDIVQKIKDACRLISAFTTAPTQKNEVSSRHVQIVWLEYKKNNICGAKISSYLLERNRVTKGQCTYQIFSQMMTALTDIEFAYTGLSEKKWYFIVSDLNFRNKEKFHNEFCDTLRAMDILGFTIHQKKNIFQVLSLIIHMGNIQFVQEDDCCRIDTNNEQSKEAFENACRLACLNKEDLAELLTSILISPQSLGRRHSMCRRNLNTEDACNYRLRSVIRHLYDLLFCWLIKSVNEILSSHLCHNNRLGILDTFGFECFKINGIEQLCVNYVNERLQQYFIEKYVTCCRRDLQEENLIEKEISLNCYNILQLYMDRLTVIKKMLFDILNDICLSTIPNNIDTLIRHVKILIDSNQSTSRFLTMKDENFVIRHYAGKVEYNSNDLFSKNTDKIPDELTIAFSTSKNRFLYSLIMENNVYGKSHVKKHTMLSKLCQNVDWLIQELNKCDVHYVRCIKPCRFSNKDWDRDGLYKQLANTGILHALPLAKCKYPIYFSYEEFCKRYYGNYGKLKKINDISFKITESFSSIVKDINSSIHYGKNFIFLKEDFFLILEFTRKQCHIKSVKKIESFWIKCRRKAETEITGKNPKNMPEIEKIEDASINISATIAPSQDNKKNIVNTNNYPISIGMSLISLQDQEEKLRKINNTRTKSSIQNIQLIQNHQLENSFYQRYILYCTKLEQEQNQIISEISYFPSDLQKTEKTDVLTNISEIAILPQDNRKSIIDTNNYPISIAMDLVSLQYQEEKQIKINNTRTKSNIQNMSIQNRQLENNFYQRYILYCANLKQEKDQIIPEISYFPSDLHKVKKTDLLINISATAVPFQDNRRDIIDMNNYPISIGISLVSLQYQEEKLKKTNNTRTKSNTQNMSIQNCQLENNFYQTHILYRAKFKQEQNQIIPEISYFPSDSQKVEKIDALTNISETAVPSQDNRKNITNNYFISIGISLVSLQHQEEKLRKTNNARTKSNIQNMSIQNRQLESFYQKHILHCANTEQKQDQIISYLRNDSQVIYDKPENKDMYIIKWLKNMNETMNVTNEKLKDTKLIQSASKQSPVIHDHNQSIHISCNNPLQSILNINTIRARGKREKNLEDYDKENDVYIIPQGGSTLFYKNGILSRRRPTRLPVKVHTRTTCLTNSHYTVYTELPKGLQDCL